MIRKSIGLKIGSVLIILITVILSTMLIGYLGMNSTQQGLESVYNDRVVPLEQLKEISDLYAVNIVDTAHKLRNGNLNWDEADKGIVDAITKIDLTWEKYRNTYLTVEESKIADEVEKLFIPAKQSVNDLLQFIQDKDQAGVETFTINELYPSIDPLTSKINELILLQLTVAKEKYDEAQKRLQIILISMIGLLVVAILSIAVAIVVVTKIVNVIKSLRNKLEELALNGGDLTQKIEVNSQDELGQMGNAVNLFLGNLKDIITSIKTSSAEMVQMSDGISESVIQLNGEVEQISAITQELAAGMEQTNASTQEMHAISQEVSEISINIAHKAEAAASNARDIGLRAKSVQTIAIESNQRATDMYQISQENLIHAVSEAKKVENINELAQVILGITNQTNLLALNAAIEAARAGEAGKGFAVVADEIRKLAEDSKQSVSKIQEVTQIIVTSVNNLSNGATDIMSFINNSVKADYLKFIEIGEQYNQDANYVSEMATDLNASSEEMTALMQTTVQIISEISKAANEAATGSTEIATRTSDLQQESTNISKVTTENTNNANNMKKLVQKFTV